MHENFLVEIAAMDILEDHSLSKLVKIHSLFRKDQAFKYSTSEHMFGIAVFCFLILFTHCFQQHCASYLPSALQSVLCSEYTLVVAVQKIIITLLSESSNKIVHFEVWIKKRLNNGRISRLLVGREEHAPRTLVLHGGFNFKHCAEWPFHSEQVTYT